MRCIKLFFVYIIILLCNCYSQENLIDISLKDSIKNFNSIQKDLLQFKNFFRSNSKKILGKDDLLGLELYQKAINDSSIVNKYPGLKMDDYSEEELAYFKESFNQLMDMAKRNHYKYDLGEVGRYLGVSRNILAVILAIISVVK